MSVLKSCSKLNRFRLHHWPILTSAWCITTFLVAYVVSVSNGHVYACFPYISDTGTKPPESCIFGQMLNIEAVLLGITLYVRHEQVEAALAADDGGRAIDPTWNRWSLPFGTVACLGISVVANFQETNVLHVHLLGATMTFGLGLVYFCMQAKVSFAFRKAVGSVHRIGRPVIYLRTILAASGVVLFPVASICSTLSARQFKGDSIEYWTKEDGGFTLRLIGTVSEWTTAVLMMVFVLTFSGEFKTIEFKRICFERRSSPNKA